MVNPGSYKQGTIKHIREFCLPFIKDWLIGTYLPGYQFPLL